MLHGMNLIRFFHPVLPAKDLKGCPAAVSLGGVRWVLFRDGQGIPGALLDRCPHRMAPLSAGRVRPDGRLACTYHGWNFDRYGHGRSPSQPDLKKCDVPSFQVLESAGYLWLAGRDVAPSRMPTLGWDEFQQAGAFTTVFEASLQTTLDNFSEDEHFPYIHQLLGWDDAHANEIRFEAHNFDDRSEVCYQGPQRPSPFLPVVGVRAGDRFQNEWVTRFDPLHAIFTFHWFDPATRRPRPLTTRSAVFLVPEAPRRTRVTTFVYVRIAPSPYRLIRPLVHRLAMLLGQSEVKLDAEWCGRLEKSLEDAWDTAAGYRTPMRLGHFDKPLVHNRKLLRTLYLGVDASASQGRESDEGA